MFLEALTRAKCFTAKWKVSIETVQCIYKLNMDKLFLFFSHGLHREMVNYSRVPLKVFAKYIAKTFCEYFI